MNSDTIPSGHRGSAMQHESVPVPRELSQALSAMAHERNESKTMIWRRAIKLCLAMEDPKRFFEMASKGLLCLALIFTTLLRLLLNEPDTARLRNNRRDGSRIRISQREEVA